MSQHHPASAKQVRILGIETSCDETAAGIIVRDEQGRGRIEANVIRSQWEEHRAFGGVVPEIAARAHVECIDEIIALALAEAGVTLDKIDAVASTAGPGLIGGLLVGLTTAKAIATATRKPLLAINHLEAHALTVGLTNGLAPPYMLLLVSGGHTQIVLVAALGHYYRLGTTIDDALGEAFDKTAKLLDLGFPGGPAVERHAQDGDPRRFDFPTPLKGRPEPHFSFAGLKTAVRRQAQKLAPLSPTDIADLCASFERAVCDSVGDRIVKAYEIAMTDYARFGTSLPLVAAGGVARNTRLRHALEQIAAAIGVKLYIPPAQLCTDNGAMIAWAGAEHYINGHTSSMGFAARARWPLDETSPAVYGSGKHGAKA
ncbi:MAG: tRNA (adenosine(37)-N6)-threonylcarbamoyltransferase complex transferase subunit TsaD [Pseudomonadota bacterium]